MIVAVLEKVVSDITAWQGAATDQCQGGILGGYTFRYMILSSWLSNSFIHPLIHATNIC